MTHRDWTRRRIYDEEALQLATERRFVQYRPKPEEVDASHEKALSDIHHLISRHGAGGAWLWDPYLDARDILDTLFFCPHIGADLRALTAGKIPPEIKRPQPISYAEKQRAIFDSAESNYRGLRLTYRIKSGTAGWKFHDRFLIFPNSTGQVLAWSLGASINILGKAHHILQRVDNGRLIMEAFLDLWDQLSAPEHTILEKP